MLCEWVMPMIPCCGPQDIAVGDLVILSCTDMTGPALVLSATCDHLGDIEVFVSGSKKIFSWAWVHHIYKITKT
jgi:hypothetical protein